MVVIITCRDATDTQNVIEEYKAWVVHVDWTSNEVYLSAGKGDFAQDAEYNFIHRS